MSLHHKTFNLRSWVTLAFVAAFVFPRSLCATTLYDINFDNYAIGTTFERGTAPAEFSGTHFDQGSSVPPFAQAEITASSLGLTNQPLLQHTYSASEAVYYDLEFVPVSSGLIQLNLQLALDSNSEASIAFYSPVVDGNISLILAHFIGNEIQLQSREGVVFSPDVLFQTNAPIDRTGVFNVSLQLNTQTGKFSFYLNSSALALDANFGTSNLFNVAEIGLGDVLGASGGTGDAAIDNILFTASSIPEPSTFILAAFGLAGIFALHRRRRQPAGKH